MTNAAADVGALNKGIDLQKSFVSDLMDSIKSGVGKLVDADMNEDVDQAELCRRSSSSASRLSRSPTATRRTSSSCSSKIQLLSIEDKGSAANAGPFFAFP